MVRDTLGEDAIIVATREEEAGKSVRVTAAVEQTDSYEDDIFSDVMEREPSYDNSYEDRNEVPHFELGTVDSPASAEGWLQYDEEDEENAVVEKLTDVMIRHGATEDITDQILSCATVMGISDAYQSLILSLEHLYSFQPLAQKPSNTATMLVGPPGSGKTLAIAKLAARCVMNRQRVAVISTDTVRAGGVEQLSAFTNLMRINLKKVSSAQELRAALQEVETADQVFIDTSGVNPFSTEEMRDLARLIAAGNINPVLAMPAGIDPDESGEIGRAYAALGVKSLLPTRLDVARRFGGILGAAHHGGLVFADASNTNKVAEGLIKLTPKRLAHLLMPQAAKKQSSSRDKTATRPRKTKRELVG